MFDLLKAKELAGSSRDEVIDYVRLLVALSQKDPDTVKGVPIKPLPPKLRASLEDKVYAKACYHNTWEAMKKLKGKDCKYVLGYWYHLIPIEHCFLKIGELYYDPTYEILFEPDASVRHFAIEELSYEEVKACRMYMKKIYRINDHIGLHEWERYRVNKKGA